MKIGIYDPYLDTLGGGERYMLTAAECLSGAHDVIVFWDDPKILDKAEVKFGLNLKNITTTKNVFSKKSLKLIRFLKTLRYDRILYLSDGSMPLLPAKKTFIHFQSPIKESDASVSSKAKLKATKGIIVNSRYTKKFIDKAFAQDSTVIYPPVETDKFKGNAAKSNTILTVGRYSSLPTGDFKKHSVMINSFKNVIDKNVGDWKLEMVITHLPSDKKRVEELKKSIGKYPIRIHTDLTNSEVIKMYEKAKIYWHAAGYGEDLQLNPQHAEHFGIAVVEAMAAGAVPVVFKAGGLSEIIKDNQTGLLWTDLPSLISSTTTLMKNEDKRKKISSNAQKEADNFSKIKFCERIKDLLK